MPGPAGCSGRCYLLWAGEAGSLTSSLLLGCRGAGAKKRNREDKGQVSNPSQPHAGGQGSSKAPLLPAWCWTLLFPCHPIASGSNAARHKLCWQLSCPRSSHGKQAGFSIQASATWGPRGAQGGCPDPGSGAALSTPKPAVVEDTHPMARTESALVLHLHGPHLPSSEHLPSHRHQRPDHKPRSSFRAACIKP